MAQNPFKRKSQNPLTQKRRLKGITKRIFRANTPLNSLQNHKLSRTTLLCFFIGLILLIGYITFSTSFFHIKTITVYEGGLKTDNMQIRKLLEPLRNRNILLFKLDPVVKNLNSKIDNLANLKVEKNLPSTLKISFARLKNVANITNTFKDTRKSLIVNEAGTVTQENKKIDDAPLIFLASDKAYAIGDQIITKQNLKYILDAKIYFEEKINIKVIDMEYLTKAREIHLNTEKGFSVWIDTEQDFKTQINKLKNAIPKLNVFEDKFEYIDLRIQSAEGQKIIYMH